MFAKIVSALLAKIVLVVLILLLIGALPVWRYSARWGFLPAAVIAIMALVVYVFARLGRI